MCPFIFSLKLLDLFGIFVENLLDLFGLTDYKINQVVECVL